MNDLHFDDDLNQKKSPKKCSESNFSNKKISGYLSNVAYHASPELHLTFNRRVLIDDLIPFISSEIIA